MKPQQLKDLIQTLRSRKHARSMFLHLISSRAFIPVMSDDALALETDYPDARLAAWELYREGIFGRESMTQAPAIWVMGIHTSAVELSNASGIGVPMALLRLRQALESGAAYTYPPTKEHRLASSERRLIALADESERIQSIVLEFSHKLRKLSLDLNGKIEGPK